MGCTCCKSKKNIATLNQKKITLLVLGLEGAGKSTVVRRITKKPLDDVVPTIGFAVHELMYKGCNVQFFDLGGSPKIRGIWKQYFADAHGLIFVVNSSDFLGAEECRQALRSVLTDDRMAGKPVLLLANKQDLEGAMDEIDIVEKLQLEALVNQQKCPTLVELCAAAASPDKRDPGIKNGFKWLIRNITKDYPALNNRVLVDMTSQEEIEREAQAVRRQRLEVLRSLEDITVINEEDSRSDPFKPISHILVNPVTNSLPSSRLTPVEDQEDNEDVAMPTNIQLFFKSQDWKSTAELLDELPDSKPKNSYQRPKSSSALEFPTKKRRKQKRRLRFKKNKTAPQPMVDLSRPQVSGPIPAIFDLTYTSEVTVFSSKRESKPMSGEVLLDATNLSL